MKSDVALPATSQTHNDNKKDTEPNISAYTTNITYNMIPIDRKSNDVMNKISGSSITASDITRISNEGPSKYIHRYQGKL